MSHGQKCNNEFYKYKQNIFIYIYLYIITHRLLHVNKDSIKLLNKINIIVIVEKIMYSESQSLIIKITICGYFGGKNGEKIRI